MENNLPFVPPTDYKKAVEEKLIRSHVLWAAGAGLIPIPALDVAFVTAIQKDLVKKLAELYGHEFSEAEVRAWVTSLVASASARMAADALKFIPGVGTLVGGVTMAVLSGASTYAIGKVFRKHFESGGTFLDFKPEKFKDYFVEQYEKGKDVVQKWIDERTTSKTQAPPEGRDEALIRKLKDISQLHHSGMLSNEEYMAWKQKLIHQF